MKIDYVSYDTLTNILMKKVNPFVFNGLRVL